MHPPARWRSTRLAALVALCSLASSQLRAADVGAMSESMRLEGIRRPGEGGKRIKVSLGVYLVDFARINLREESFDMAGYLDVRWTDPSIALKADERKGRVRRFRPGQVWTPALEFVNAVEQVAAEREGDLYVDDDGRVSQRVRFSHKFQSPFRLKRFPFDSQELAVVVAPFDPFAKDLDLMIDKTRVGKLSEASVTDWTSAPWTPGSSRARVATSATSGSSSKFRSAAAPPSISGESSCR